MLFDVSIQLESDIYVGPVEIRLWIFVDIYRHGVSVDAQANVMHLSIDALEEPGDVMPGIGGKYWAWKAGGDPFESFWVPYVPFAGAFEIALAAPDIAGAVERLIHIELQRF